MPYKAVPSPEGGDKYDVVNTETNEVRATHEPPDAKAKAERQIQLLHEVEKDPEWEAPDNA